MKKGGGPALRKELGDIGYLESHQRYVSFSKNQAAIGFAKRFRDVISKWKKPLLSPLMDQNQ